MTDSEGSEWMEGGYSAKECWMDGWTDGWMDGWE